MENKKADKVIFAVDVSGSTDCKRDYFEKVKAIYNELKEQYNEVTILLWNSYCRNVNEIELLDIISNRKGNGGTYPHTFADVHTLPPDSNLVIITDGQIEEDKIERCDNIVNSRPFNSIIVWFIDTDGPMNFSVSTPFTRNCLNVTINIRRRNDQHVLSDALIMKGNTRDPVVLEKYFDNPDLFVNELDNLIGVVMLKNVGKESNIPLRNSLLDLQKNLFSVLARRASQRTDWKTLDRLLTTEYSYNECVEFCKSLIVGNDTKMKIIEAGIAHLIKLCTGNRDYSFNNLRPQRLERANPVANAEELPPVEEVSKVYECPISLNNDLPVVTIVEGEHVLFDVDKKYLDYIISMPLEILNNDTLMGRIISRISHTFGHGAICELFRRGNNAHPYTRKTMVSVLIPYVPKDERTEKLYYKANVHALANIFFGEKLEGNVGLWFAVIWQTIKKIPYLYEDKKFMNVFESFLIEFWKSNKTRITLSGLPVEPMILAPMSISFWYCLSSIDIHFKRDAKSDDDKNRLRALGTCAKHLIPCVELLNYCYNKEFTKKQIAIYEAFAWMMNQEKDPNSNWRSLINACYQNSIVLNNGKIIFLDGPPRLNVELPEILRNLPLGIVLSLEKLVDKSKKLGDIFIPMNLEASPIPNFVTNYGYPELTEEQINAVIEISPKTYRPLYRKQGRKWSELAIERYGRIENTCCNFKYFIDFVFRYNKYPENIEEFIIYVAERQANREVNPVDTLPRYQLGFTRSLFRDYESVLGKNFQDVTVQEFKKKVLESTKPEDRVKLDGTYL